MMCVSHRLLWFNFSIARGRLSHSAVGDKSQVQDTGTSGGGSGSCGSAGIGSTDTVTETRIKPRSR